MVIHKYPTCLNNALTQISVVYSWFLGAVMALSCQPQLLKSLFVEYSEEAGVYAVRFYKDGLWECVVVDDFVAVEDDEVGAV